MLVYVYLPFNEIGYVESKKCCTGKQKQVLAASRFCPSIQTQRRVNPARVSPSASLVYSLRHTHALCRHALYLRCENE
jgi:hypothetical protein